MHVLTTSALPHRIVLESHARRFAGSFLRSIGEPETPEALQLLWPHFIDQAETTMRTCAAIAFARPDAARLQLVGA